MANTAAITADVWRRMAFARARSQWQYRGSFVLFVIGQALTSFIDFLALLAIFTQIDALGGWSVAEVALLYGMASTSFHITDQVLGSLDHLPLRIQDGSFDSYLLRPAGALVQVTADGFALRRMGKLLQAVPVLIVALAAVDISWSPLTALHLVVAVVSGALIFGGVWVVGVTICFWVIDAREFVNAFTYGGNFLANQPMDIYSAWFRRLFVVIPIAFVNYLPALSMLGKERPDWAPEILSYVSPIVAVAVAVLANAVWRFGVRHYRSTGS